MAVVGGGASGGRSEGASWVVGWGLGDFGNKDATRHLPRHSTPSMA